jgi:hypothetical protein
VHAVIFRPYKYRLANIINIICEAVITLVSLLIFGFIHEENDGLQWVVIILITLAFIANIILLILVLIAGINHIRHSFRDRTSRVDYEIPPLNLVRTEHLGTEKAQDSTKRIETESRRFFQTPLASRRVYDMPHRIEVSLAEDAEEVKE